MQEQQDKAFKKLIFKHLFDKGLITSTELNILIKKLDEKYKTSSSLLLDKSSNKSDIYDSFLEDK